MSFRVHAVIPLFGLVGCYTYQPIEAATVPVGTEVRAHITGAASDRVAPMLGTFDVRTLSGSVTENSNGSMMLEVPNGARANVTEGVVPLHARVSIAPGDLVSLERRKLDVGRTTMLTAAIVGGVSLGVALALHSGADPQPGNLPNEPPTVIRIPIHVIRF
jgi:hypothetical protein